MEKKATKKKRLAVLDIVIIIVIIAGIVGAAARYRVIDSLFSESTSQKAVIKFYTDKMTSEEAESFSDGAAVYCNDVFLGKLSSAVKSNHVSYTENFYGELISSVADGFFDVEGNITATLTYGKKEGYRLNGEFIGAGTVIDISVGNTCVPATVISIEEMKK